MEEVKKSKFDFEVPIKISVVAPRDINNDSLYKMAYQKLMLSLKIQIFEVDETRLDFVKETKLLTAEEIAYENAVKDLPFNEWFERTVRGDLPKF